LRIIDLIIIVILFLLLEAICDAVRIPSILLIVENPLSMFFDVLLSAFLLIKAFLITE